MRGLNALFSFILSLALAACGGGGGSSDVDSAPAAPKPAATDLVIIGNSISYVPPGGTAQSGVFTGGWGVAASSMDKDYAHIVAKALKLPLLVENHAELEVDPTAPLPVMPVTPTTIVVVELGDNRLPVKYGELLASLQGAHTFVCVSTWWSYADRDAVIERECAKAGGRYAWIGDLWPNRQDPVGTYENPTVDNHPQDWGMAHIAERVLAVLHR